MIQSNICKKGPNAYCIETYRLELARFHLNNPDESGSKIRYERPSGRTVCSFGGNNCQQMGADKARRNNQQDRRYNCKANALGGNMLASGLFAPAALPTRAVIAALKPNPIVTKTKKGPGRKWRGHLHQSQSCRQKIRLQQLMGKDHSNGCGTANRIKCFANQLLNHVFCHSVSIRFNDDGINLLFVGMLMDGFRWQKLE